MFINTVDDNFLYVAVNTYVLVFYGYIKFYKISNRNAVLNLTRYTGECKIDISRKYETINKTRDTFLQADII